MDQSAKFLVVYFTRSGNTEQLAQALASMLGANCERIREQDDRSRRAGPLGYVRSLLDVLTHRPAALGPPLHDVSSYDVVAIGTPVWAGHAATPVSAWLRLNQGRLKQVAFFCSMGARGSETAFDEMQALSGRAPIATCAISARQISHEEDRGPVEAFAQRIRHAVATVQSVTPGR